jgi:hypothetical protein
MTKGIVDQFRLIGIGETGTVKGKRSVIVVTRRREEKNGKKFVIKLPEEKIESIPVTRIK